MGITRHGIEHFYLRGTEDHKFVPRKALVEAVGLIDEAYEKAHEESHLTYETLARIQPVERLESSKTMIAIENGKAFHKTGSYPIYKDELISIWGITNDFYCGHVFYSGFIDIYFPKELLRERRE